jgi:dihydrofolate reductase
VGKICAVENVSLDGVYQAPAAPDEDTRRGFTHGGWAFANADHVAAEFMAEGMTGTGAMLFGHRTYRQLLGYWSTAPQPNPFTDVLLNSPKYVVSRNIGATLTYPNSTLLAGEAIETVAGLTEKVDGDITILGSGELVRSLQGAGLIDAYVLQIHPTVLGSGLQLFGPADRRDFTLVRSVVTTTGVFIAEYSVR